MSGILNDIRLEMQKRDNAHIKLIVINSAIFLAIAIPHVIMVWVGTAGLQTMVQPWLALSSAPIEAAQKPWTIITYMFYHQDIMHILFNMLVLFWFGMILNDLVGGKKVISAYIYGGVFGGLLFLLAYNLIPAFQMRGATPLLGASAGVYGVVLAAAVLAPDYSINIILFGPVKIKYIAAFYIVSSFLYTIGTNAGGNFAHLGGGLAGWLYIARLRAGYDMGTPLYAIGAFFENLAKPRPTMRVTYQKKENRSKQGQAMADAKPAQEEIDRILDKISRQGLESLTREEKQKLHRFSEQE